MVHSAVIDHLPSSQTTMTPLSWQFLKQVRIGRKKQPALQRKIRKSDPNRLFEKKKKKNVSLISQYSSICDTLIKDRKIHQASQPSFKFPDKLEQKSKDAIISHYNLRLTKQKVPRVY